MQPTTQPASTIPRRETENRNLRHQFEISPSTVRVLSFYGTISGTDAGQWFAKETGLLWFQQAVFFSELHPNKRGVYDLGPPRLRGGDIFGFFRFFGSRFSIRRIHLWQQKNITDAYCAGAESAV
jgi:hypothetical protein